MMKPVFMTYTKKDLINLGVCMVLSLIIIPTFIKTEYWYSLQRIRFFILFIIIN